jgi:hypothetical protein
MSIAENTAARTVSHNRQTVAWTPTTNGMPTTLPLSADIPWTASVPAPSTTPQVAPALPEAACSVNLFFEVAAGYGKAQATGRGANAQEAAANLKATIEATRAILAPPPLASRTERLAALLACGTQKALASGNTARLDRLARAYLLVVKGMVGAVTVNDVPTGAYEVQSQTTPGKRYFVESQSCECQDARKHADDPSFFCMHSLAALYVTRLDAQEAEVL